MEYADLVSSMNDLERSKNETDRKLEDALKELKSHQKLMDDKEEQITEASTCFFINHFTSIMSHIINIHPPYFLTLFCIIAYFFIANW